MTFRVVLCIGLLSIVYPHSSEATSSYVGKIEQIHNGSANQLFLILENDQNNKPACANNASYDYVFDPSTEHGKARLTIALAAYVAGKEVYLGGSQTCSFYSNVEDLLWIRAQ